MSRELKALTHVVAAALLDSAGRVLIAQRPPGKHLAGGWEFPGGKLEAFEDRRAGLARELREELGIILSGPPRPLIRVRHRYDSGEVLIDMWVVRRYAGAPRGLDGQALRWCSRDELESVDMLPADAPIVAALRLPERLSQSFHAGLCDRALRGRGRGRGCRRTAARRLVLKCGGCDGGKRCGRGFFGAAR